MYDDFTAAKVSSFACSLVEKGEYYRAYVELLRLNSYYPSFLDASVSDISVMYLFYKSKRYDNLLDFDFSRIRDDLFIPVSLFRIDSLIGLDRMDDAENELKKLSARTDKDRYSEYLKKRSVYLSVMSNKNSDKKYKDYNSDYEELYIYSENIYCSRKNPLIGALAGIVPGMGYVYAGESGTGIVSMIVIGACSAVTYSAYSRGMDSLAVVSGLITFFFYGGSIAGGYMQSVKYNNRLVETLEMKLNRELMPERDLDEIYFKFGLNSNDCK